MSNRDKNNLKQHKNKQRLFSSSTERADRRQKIHLIRRELIDSDEIDFVSDRNGFVHKNID